MIVVSDPSFLSVNSRYVGFTFIYKNHLMKVLRVEKSKNRVRVVCGNYSGLTLCLSKRQFLRYRKNKELNKLLNEVF